MPANNRQFPQKFPLVSHQKTLYKYLSEQMF